LNLLFLLFDFCFVFRASCFVLAVCRFAGSRMSKTAAKTLDRRRSLEGIPAWNPGVSRRAAAKEDETEVVVPQRRRPGLLGRFQPEHWEQKFVLDALGSFVIRQIDGKRSVLEITERFIERHKVNRREAELSVTAFLKTLLERSIISIGIR
jgi:hypothetical protein